MMQPTAGSRGGLSRRHLSGGENRPDVITSRNNKWLKSFREVLRGTGPSTGEMIGVEGPKLVEDALRAGLEAEALILSETGAREIERVLKAASESETGIPRSRVLRTTDKMFAGITGTGTPQGVAALFRQPVWGLEDVLRGRASRDGAFRGGAALVVVLAEVRDPGNVGTILRSSEAFGATGAVATRGTADPWSPKALRASAGSALRLPLLRGMAIPVLLAQLKMQQVKILAACSRAGAKTIVQEELRQFLREPVAIFIGNEGAGLPNELDSSADAWISIPMEETVESLNAGVAASLLLYEAARQRKAT